MMSIPFAVLDQSYIYRDGFLAFRKDRVRTADGEVIERKVVEYHSSSAVVPIAPDSGDRVLLIRHFRYPIDKYIWEIPGGMRKRDESGEDFAAREFQEETGYGITGLKHLLTFFPEPAFTNQSLSLYVGTVTDLYETSKQSEPEIRESRWFAWDEVEKMIRNGEIGSSWSIIGLLLTTPLH